MPMANNYISVSQAQSSISNRKPNIPVKTLKSARAARMVIQQMLSIAVNICQKRQSTVSKV